MTDKKIPYCYHLLFRVVEIQRIYEATATPCEEGANLSEMLSLTDRTIRGFDYRLSGPLIS